MLCKIIILLVLQSFVSDAAKLHNLGGSWLLSAANGKYVDLEATVPGGIYTDLMTNSVIGDIFYGHNDDTTRWVPRLNWTYFRNFTVDDELVRHENVNIVFDGLDTFATIAVNDLEIGKSENMFVQYIFNIKKFIKAGLNKIEVRFQSPIEVAARLAEEQSKLYSIPVNCPPKVHRGECHVNMIRKMQASFSWDWGPSFPSMGIWKDLYVEAYDETIIRYVVTDTNETEDSWILNVDTYFAENANRSVEGKIIYELRLNTINLTRVADVSVNRNQYNETTVTETIEIPKGYVNAWWPNGYGAHELYNLTVTFSTDDESEASSKSIRVGFRTIELIQDALDSGLTFYFKVNGVPMFMKGSNQIPIDILPERGQNKTTVKKLLTSAYDTHMNMLRVWGGGVYESDYFYDLADELGILVWQDFMFACSLYPVNADFINNVLEEVRHQVKRLRSHASVALFSGNNENEGALANDWYDIRNNFTLYKKDYVKLYIDTIKTEFERLTRKRAIFITSSPTNGKESEKEGYVAKDPGSSFYGDVHFYNYVLNSFDTSFYPVPRFASECGYQSLPSVDTLLTATNNISDLNINSSFLDHRQHHPLGNVAMQFLMAYQLKLPNDTSANYYKAFIYYSQIVQAMSTKLQTEHYRRYKSYLDAKGQGYTMGALYWQLNDVWVAPTWAGIDYTGKWKMLHYFAADFFAPVIITGHINLERTVEIYVVSDLLSPIYNVTATTQVYKWEALEPISVETLTVDLEAGKSHLIDSFNIDDYLSDKDCGSWLDARYNCFLYLILEKESAKIAPDNFVLPASVKDSKLQQPKVQISSVKKIGSQQVYDIEITTDHVALFVWLDSHGVNGAFSENGFIQVNRSRHVYFDSEDDVDADRLLKALTVTNLLDENIL